MNDIYIQLAITIGTQLLQTGFENLTDEEDSVGFLLPFGGKGKEGKGKTENKGKWKYQGKIQLNLYGKFNIFKQNTDKHVDK